MKKWLLLFCLWPSLALAQGFSAGFVDTSGSIGGGITGCSGDINAGCTGIVAIGGIPISCTPTANQALVLNAGGTQYNCVTVCPDPAGGTGTILKEATGACPTASVFYPINTVTAMGLGSLPVTLTPINTLVTIGTAALTMPTTGGPWRVHADGVICTATTSAIVGFQISDGTTVWGTSTNVPSNLTGAAYSISDISPSYANSAAVTMTVTGSSSVNTVTVPTTCSQGAITRTTHVNFSIIAASN